MLEHLHFLAQLLPIPFLWRCALWDVMGHGSHMMVMIMMSVDLGCLVMLRLIVMKIVVTSAARTIVRQDCSI